MPDTKDIKNIALIGHGGEGKTSVADAMLWCAKATDRIGKVADGNTVMDYEPEEIARKISLSLAVANFMWEGVKINLIDVPGFFDFEGERVQALDAADGAIVVTGADGIVSVGTEKALDFCIERGIPVMIFINQMDKDNADYLGTVEALKAKYLNKIAPIQIPVMREHKMQGYISLLTGRSYEFAPEGRLVVDMPEEYKEDYAALKGKLVDVAASNDDDLMAKFFEDEVITQEEIVLGVRKGLAAGDAIPVLAGSAVQNKGIINLLNQILRIMPSPAARIYRASSAVGGQVELSCSNGGGAKTVCRVFKTIADPFVGRLSFFKVIYGTVKPGVSLYNCNSDKPEKVSGLYTLKGKRQESVEELVCGDIGAFAKLQYTKTGDTLTDGIKLVIEPMDFPAAVYTMAVTSVKQGEEEKVFGGLYKLTDEDMTLKITRGAAGETLISGLGETQLDVTVKRLKVKFGAEAKLTAPKVPYRETIKKTAIGEGKHKKQSGGHGQYGHCFVRFEPYYDGDFLFAEEVVGGSVPRQYIPAVEKGLLECVQKGVLAGYPVVNIKCVLTDGSYHDVDSSEMAFKIAASMAFKKGCAEAMPVILEPIHTYSINVPEAYLGDIMGDLNRRRGRILGMTPVAGRQVVMAEAPSSEMVRYATDLRSMTQGRGSFLGEFARYEELTPALAAAVIASSPHNKNNQDD